ncbi:MAG: helix-turn-helix domain-containing protein [Gaiellaceae bacterium]
MSVPATSLAAALLAALDDEAVRALADRLRPYLEDQLDHRPLLTPAQAAERLRLHPKTVVRMARDGRLPGVKVGTGWRFHSDRLDIAPRGRAVTTERARSASPRRCTAELASVRAIRGEQTRKAA